MTVPPVMMMPPETLGLFKFNWPPFIVTAPVKVLLPLSVAAPE